MPRTGTRIDWARFIWVLRSESYLECTQVELAVLHVRVSPGSIHNWETGATEPSLRFRRKLKQLAIEHGYSERLWPVKPEHPTLLVQ